MSGRKGKPILWDYDQNVFLRHKKKQRIVKMLNISLSFDFGGLLDSGILKVNMKNNRVETSVLAGVFLLNCLSRYDGNCLYEGSASAINEHSDVIG